MWEIFIQGHILSTGGDALRGLQRGRKGHDADNYIYKNMNWIKGDN
jgi:hypothetical protein